MEKETRDSIVSIVIIVVLTAMTVLGIINFVENVQIRNTQDAQWIRIKNNEANFGLFLDRLGTTVEKLKAEDQKAETKVYRDEVSE